MALKIAKEKQTWLLPVQYDVTTGIIQAHTTSLNTLATAALPAEDHSAEEPGFDDATCEVLYIMETQARNLVTILADLRSKVNGRPKPVLGNVEEDAGAPSDTQTQ